MSTLKGVKVSLDSCRDVKKGIGAKSLRDLQEKIINKFDLSSKKRIKIFLPDGTEIDDEEYFQRLPPQTHLIVTTKNKLEVTSDEDNDPLEKFLQGLRWQGGARETVEQIRHLLLQTGNGENFQDLVSRWQKMAKYVEEQKQKMTFCSTAEEDPAWFQSLSTNAKTKEEYLSKSCQARVRGYLAKAETQLKTSIQVSKLSDKEKEKNQRDFDMIVETILKEFRAKLKENRFYGHYFDRKSDSAERICNEGGQFLCEGRFDQEFCSYNSEHENELKALLHFINPYETTEARIMFSTWNLDHVIERSRSIVPSIVEAILKSDGRSLNIQYFHDLLFTRKNLKLVHIVCHDKQEHSGKKCDPKMFYISKNRFTSPASCPTSRNRSGPSRCHKTSDKELKLPVKPIRKAKDTRLALSTSATKELPQKSANRKRKVCAMA